MDLDFVSMFDAIASGPAPVIDRTEVAGLIVSTVDSYDAGAETAIIDEESVYPVERYETTDEAKKGHKKWVARVKDKTFTKVTKIAYGDLVDEEEVTLKRRE